MLKKLHFLSCNFFQSSLENFLYALQTYSWYSKGKKEIKFISQKHRTKIKKVKGGRNPGFSPLPGPHAAIQSKNIRCCFQFFFDITCFPSKKSRLGLLFSKKLLSFIQENPLGKVSQRILG